jgi:hypothetical protein
MMTILVAGPYRSGTGGDAALIARNLQRLEQAALSIYRRGHVPLIGEWLALPLARAAGSTRLGDAISEDFLYPASRRLLSRCDALLRIDGESRGADEDVRVAQSLGLRIYLDIADVPPADARAQRASDVPQAGGPRGD